MALLNLLVAVLPVCGMEIVEVASERTLKVRNALTAHEHYKYLREPNAVVTSQGSLLVAFGPHHVEGRNDRAHQDILLRRSTDEGRTWSAITRITDEGMDSVLVQLGDGRIGLIFEGSRGVREWQKAKRDHNTGAPTRYLPGHRES